MIARGPSTDVVRREVVLPATREEAWVALTRSEQLSAWFEADVEIDPRPRGGITARSPDGTTRVGTVMAVNAPYRLVLVWEEGEDGRGRVVEASRVEFTLESVDEGTRLTVIETPVMPASPEMSFHEVTR